MTSKKMVCCILSFLFLMRLVNVFAVEDTFVDGTKIDAITDFSTYGAFDIVEQSAANYKANSSFADVREEPLLGVTSLLKALGVAEGDENNYFEPDKSFSRIQFAKAVLKIVNFDAAQFESEEQSYFDIPADSPYNAVVHVVNTLGYMKGFGDQSFRPEDIISFNDAVAVLVRIMGYDIQASGQGGYPSGYLSVASKLGLHKGAKAEADGSLKRGNAARLLYNCLHTTALDKYENGKEYVTTEKGTMLEFYHGIYKTTGMVNATYITGINGYSKTAADGIRIEDVIYQCGKNSYSDFLGRDVKVYYRSDDDGKYERTAVYIEATMQDDQLVISASDIVGYDNAALTYVSANKKRVAKIKPAHELIYNDVRLTEYDEGIFCPESGYIRLVKSAASTEYDIVFVYSYFNAVVYSVSAKGSILTLDLTYGQSIELDLSRDDFLLELSDQNGRMDVEVTVSTAYDADGNEVKKYSVPPIPSGALVSVFTDKADSLTNGHSAPSSDACYVRLHINRARLEGEVTAYSSSDKTVSIEPGGTFEIANDHYLFDETDEFTLTASGTFLFDFEGKIAAFLPQTSASGQFSYGYLIQASASKGLAPEFQFRILNTRGAIEKLSAAGRIKINDIRIDKADIFEQTLKASAQYTKPDFNISQLIKYKTNEAGGITEVETVTASTGVAVGFSENHLRRMAETAEYVSPEYLGGILATKKYISDGSGNTSYKNISLFGQPKMYFKVPSEESFGMARHSICKKAPS